MSRCVRIEPPNHNMYACGVGHEMHWESFRELHQRRGGEEWFEQSYRCVDLAGAVGLIERAAG